MIPKFNELMLPLLECFKDGQPHDWQVFEDVIAQKVHLTDEDKNAQYPNTPGRKIFLDRLAWARTFIFKAKLIDKTQEKRKYIITERGLDLLKQNLTSLSVKDLKKFPDFWDVKTWGNKDEKNRSEGEDVSEDSNITPQENIIANVNKINDLVKEEILEKVASMHPQLFEKLVVDLLVKMGYGVGEVTRYTSDGGIDGIIKGDHLGFEKIYVQAKRWGNKVGRREVSQFIGDILGKNAKKGVFITTSDFNNDAVSVAAISHVQIVLINGEKLAELMLSVGLGVTQEQELKIYKIDTDFFDL